jgi:hypothetical protein
MRADSHVVALVRVEPAVSHGVASGGPKIGTPQGEVNAGERVSDVRGNDASEQP